MDCTAAVIVGIVLGIIITLTTFSFMYPHGSTANKVLTKCELTLPRDQNCELTAKPIEKQP